MSRHVPGGTDVNHETPFRIVRLRADVQTRTCQTQSKKEFQTLGRDVGYAV